MVLKCLKRSKLRLVQSKTLNAIVCVDSERKRAICKFAIPKFPDLSQDDDAIVCSMPTETFHHMV